MQQMTSTDISKLDEQLIKQVVEQLQQQKDQTDQSQPAPSGQSTGPDQSELK